MHAQATHASHTYKHTHAHTHTHTHTNTHTHYFAYLSTNNIYKETHDTFAKGYTRIRLQRDTKTHAYKET
jgi:hypothetical protein